MDKLQIFENHASPREIATGCALAMTELWGIRKKQTSLIYGSSGGSKPPPYMGEDIKKRINWAYWPGLCASFTCEEMPMFMVGEVPGPQKHPTDHAAAVFEVHGNHSFHFS